MSKVIADNVNVRDGPSTKANSVAKYNKGEIITSGDLLIENEGRIWLRYKGGSGNQRYICAINNNGQVYVDVASGIPGPRSLSKNNNNNSGQTSNNSVTGIGTIPKQGQFSDNRIKKWGCCFLCTCVKGGLTTKEQCEACFEWGINSGKLRSNDCYVNCNKEEWAKQIAEKYGTTYHSDYTFQKNSHHFWLTQNGVEIFNSAGLGWRGRTD